MAPVEIIRFCTAAATKHNDARRHKSGHTDSHREGQGQAWLCLDTQLLPLVIPRSAGSTTSILQDAGLTVTASNVTISLKPYYHAQKKTTQRGRLGEVHENTQFRAIMMRHKFQQHLKVYQRLI